MSYVEALKKKSSHQRSTQNINKVAIGFISCPINVTINGQSFRIQVNEEACDSSHWLTSLGVTVSPCCGEVNCSNQMSSTECPNVAKGSDAVARNNSKSTNALLGNSIGETDNEEVSNNNNICTPAVGSSGSVFSQDESHKKMDMPEGIQAVMTAQDTPRGDLFGPRSEPVPRLDRDTFRDLEAQWLLPRGSKELNSDCKSGLSLVPWYPTGSQPSTYPPKPSHVSQTPLSSSSSELPNKHQAMQGVSLNKAAQGNSDADIDECLADFLKRLRLEKCNSARKKKNKIPP
ncbi:hypothetical protein Ancab_022127 [Ancistrocladus abbreviatus]